MSYIWSGIKAYFKIQSKMQKLLEERTKMYMDQGYGREQASTASDMGIIELYEYNNIKKTLISQGKWK